jgi:hypothetical protein
MTEDTDLSDDIKQWMAASAAEHEERYQFVRDLQAAEFHWFFVQGVQAIRSGLYVPGVSSLLNGIEASLRVTVAQSTDAQRDSDGMSPYRVLSNVLITQAEDAGMPIQLLALPGEQDFLAKLRSEKPNRIDVEVVRLRNNICHGNVFEFINRDLGPHNAFFTPECLRDIAEALLSVSHEWAEGLGVFRKNVLGR